MSNCLLFTLFFIQIITPSTAVLVDRYLDKAGEAVLVINDSKGCYWIVNGIMKQVIFQDYSESYDNDYSLFLIDLFNGRIEIDCLPHVDVVKRIIKMPVNRITKRYLITNPDGTLSFKKKYSTRIIISVIKNMFDNGYYVMQDDYQADFYFSCEYPYYDM